MLKGKNALITGAAKRIGKEIALALASAGTNIVLHYRDSKSEAESLAGDLQKKDVKCWLVQADFEKPGDYETLIERASACCGQIDILINSASIFPAGSINELDWPELIRNIRVNAWVPFYLGRSFAAKTGKGVIINLLDSRIRSLNPSHAAYILSKKLLEYLTLMMAGEFAPGIRVNAVAPGLILPPQGEDESYLENLIDSVPLKRHGSAHDIAQTVMLLVNNDFITGEIIFVDGGMNI